MHIKLVDHSYFEAVAEGTGFLPPLTYLMPIAEPQIATVIVNEDPKGRVQVRLGVPKV